MSPAPTTTLSSLTELFPLTSPIPNALTHPAVLHRASLASEEDLLVQPDDFKLWWNYIQATKERLAFDEKREEEELAEKESEESPASTALGPLKCVLFNSAS